MFLLIILLFLLFPLPVFTSPENAKEVVIPYEVPAMETDLTTGQFHTKSSIKALALNLRATSSNANEEQDGEDYPDNEWTDEEFPDEEWPDEEFPDEEWPDEESPDDEWRDDEFPDNEWRDDEYSDEEYSDTDKDFDIPPDGSRDGDNQGDNQPHNENQQNGNNKHSEGALSGGSRDGDYQKGRSKHSVSVWSTNEQLPLNQAAAAPATEAAITPESTEPEAIIEHTEASAENIVPKSFAATQKTLPEEAAFKNSTSPTASLPDNHSLIILSGEQLKQQALANPENLTFIQNDSKVVIPTNLLTTLLTDNSDRFHVSIAVDGTDGFQVLFAINHDELLDFDGNEFTVYIPWNSDKAIAYCYQTEGEHIPASGYENGFLIFRLTKAGTYHIAGSSLRTTSSLPEVPAAARHMNSTSAELTSSPEAKTSMFHTQPPSVVNLLLLTGILLSGTNLIIRSKKKQKGGKQ